MAKHLAEFERKPLNNGVLFETLRDLNPSPQQLKEIDELEQLMACRKDPRRTVIAQTIEDICYDFDAGGWASEEEWAGYTDQVLCAVDSLMFPEDLTERIRRVLAKGAYYMTPDELPYESQARAVVHMLKGIHE